MFNFLKYKKIYFVVSALFLVPGILSLALYRLNPSIDFTGGAVYEVKFEKQIEEDISPVVKSEDYNLESVQESGTGSYILKLSPIDDEQRQEIKSQLEEKFGALEEIRFETVGPTLGRELIIKTIVAVLIATVFIVFYIAWTFKNPYYGLAAILAMFHDTLILLGAFSLLGHFLGVEIDALFVAAVLTTLSFSLHDTIVVFDRIRESLKTTSGLSFKDICNKAISETLVRSLNNSLTIIFMLSALAFLGGETIRYFVVALLIGTIAGTYSSTFTAVPLLHSILSRKED